MCSCLIEIVPLRLQSLCCPWGFPPVLLFKEQLLEQLEFTATWWRVPLMDSSQNTSSTPSLRINHLPQHWRFSLNAFAAFKNAENVPSPANKGILKLKVTSPNL